MKRPCNFDWAMAMLDDPGLHSYIEHLEKACEPTLEQRQVFEKWIVGNVGSGIVPDDDHNSDALVYNLVHLLRGDGKVYNYEPGQDAEITSWGR